MKERTPYKELHEVFNNIRKRELSLDELGQILNVLSLELGITSADMVTRGAPADLIDKHIKRSCLRGVEIYMGFLEDEEGIEKVTEKINGKQPPPLESVKQSSQPSDVKLL